MSSKMYDPERAHSSYPGTKSGTISIEAIPSDYFSWILGIQKNSCASQMSICIHSEIYLFLPSVTSFNNLSSI